MDHSLLGNGRIHGSGFYMCSGDTEHFWVLNYNCNHLKGKDNSASLISISVW